MYISSNNNFLSDKVLCIPLHYRSYDSFKSGTFQNLLLGFLYFVENNFYKKIIYVIYIVSL